MRTLHIKTLESLFSIVFLITIWCSFKRSSSTSLLSGSACRWLNSLVLLLCCWARLWAPSPVKAFTQISLCSLFLCEVNRRARHLCGSNWVKGTHFWLEPIRGKSKRQRLQAGPAVYRLLSFRFSINCLFMKIKNSRSRNSLFSAAVNQKCNSYLFALSPLPKD